MNFLALFVLLVAYVANANDPNDPFGAFYDGEGALVDHGLGDGTISLDSGTAGKKALYYNKKEALPVYFSKKKDLGEGELYMNSILPVLRRNLQPERTVRTKAESEKKKGYVAELEDVEDKRRNLQPERTVRTKAESEKKKGYVGELEDRRRNLQPERTVRTKKKVPQDRRLLNLVSDRT